MYPLASNFTALRMSHLLISTIYMQKLQEDFLQERALQCKLICHCFFNPTLIDTSGPLEVTMNNVPILQVEY